MVIGKEVGGGLMLITVGLLWAILMPLMQKRKGDEPLNEAQVFSLARYSAAKNRYDARPTVEQMTEWLQQDLDRLWGDSENYLGLEETTRDPVMVIGPLFTENVLGLKSDIVLRRKVDEDTYFYSTYKISIFHFSDHFLGAYQANFNMVKNVSTEEQADEFFYRDVVSVRTQTVASSYTLKSGEKLEHSKTFALTVASGDKIEVVINDPKIKASAQIETLGDEAVSNVRAMLRQYKVMEQTA